MFRPPITGWAELVRGADPFANVRLAGWKLLPGPLVSLLKTMLGERLHLLAEDFETKVWGTGLKQIVTASTKKGMFGQFGDVKVMSYTIAGRMMIQFERGNAMFSIAALDDEPVKTSFGGINSTFDQAKTMLGNAIRF